MDKQILEKLRDIENRLKNIEEVLKIKNYLDKNGSVISRNTSPTIDLTDPVLPEAIKLLKNRESVSASFLQRYLSIGYSRAARLMDTLEHEGYIGKSHGAAPRKVIKTRK